MSALSSPTAAADRNANAIAAEFAVSYGAGFEPAPDLKVLMTLKILKMAGKLPAIAILWQPPPADFKDFRDFKDFNDLNDFKDLIALKVPSLPKRIRANLASLRGQDGLSA